MATSSPTVDCSTIESRREFLANAREEAFRKHRNGDSGIDVCNWFSDQLDELLTCMLNSLLSDAGVADDAEFSVICVGGNGRRRPAPYSDVDLLLVADSKQLTRLESVFSAFVRDCWDTGFQLGHSIRPPEDVVRFANEDIQFATSLIDMRHLLGSTSVFDSLSDLVQRKVFRDPVDQFVDKCVASRREEWQSCGDSVNQLEPDLKRSPGGLRDLHLIRWVSWVQFGDTHPMALLEHNAVGTQELATLNVVDEFLTSLRFELHSRAGLKQDVLTRELQLEIVRSRGETDSDPRRAVESFMQEYFQQTSRVADIARRVTETEVRPGLFSRLRRAIMPSKIPAGFVVEQGVLSITDEFQQKLQSEPEKVMDLFVLAAEEQLHLSPDLRRQIRKLTRRLPAEPSRESCRRFRAILRSGHGLPAALRSMFETEVLDWLIPEVSGIRCLMQFNQYHSYTVDEHTMKTIDEVVSFADEDSPVGTAYQSVRHKASLHTALILHDIGKGRDGDHSIIGEQIAEGVCVRLQTPENKKRMIMFLVRQHLIMPDLAFRRDITDQTLLVDFARLVGAPELLRMLYVLCVADIKAVGPDVWTDWKGDLLADLYNRTMLILSGRPINHLERERLELVRTHVRTSLTPEQNETSASLPAQISQDVSPEWIDRQLSCLPPFYLMMESPDRIARDLDVIQQLDEQEVRIEGSWDAETDTVTYRVFAGRTHERDSFHKVAGVLSGLRMDILAAQTCTTAESMLIGSFHVQDNDFVGEVPESRIDDVRTALTNVLTGKQTVDHIFRRSGLFKLKKKDRLIEPVDPHVSIDNDCSEANTVIDVFATDNPGLLYTLALTLNQNEVEVELTRIATNVDQVVDVFYVVDKNGEKLTNPEKLEKLQADLMHELTELQKQFQDS